ncbi:ABC transporter substrate-binding protein [Acidimicrobiaceae bacterium AH-315-P05]|nr:ABC transporter substrate-binding protein [Acidimicrobiaceae bacterium AH-315-P05]
MRRMKLILVVLLAFAMMAAACGDSDGDDGASAPEPADNITTGIGVDESTIKIGFLADLTGIFAGLTVPITDGSEAYFERLNDNGGIAGRNVEAIVLDTGYDVPTHQEHYDTFSGSGENGVVMIGTSTGSPHTASIRSDLVDDDLSAVVLSWNSSWSTPESSNVLEWGANYCIEAMNGVSYLADQNNAQTLAIVSFPGDYGEDGAEGAKIAAAALGLEVVYDGQAAVVPGSDQTPVITEVVNSGADIVWATTNSGLMAEIMGGAAASGFDGQWGGNGPSFSPLLLDTDIGPLLDTNYTHFQPYAAIGSGDSAGMADLLSMMREYRPEAQFLSVYVISWIEGEIVRQALEQAAANGDLTRAGVSETVQSMTIDMQGLMPDLNFGSDNPNDIIVRSSFVFDVSLDSYNADATVLDDSGDGLVLLDDAYTSDVAKDWDYSPCFAI